MGRDANESSSTGLDRRNTGVANRPRPMERGVRRGRRGRKRKDMISGTSSF